MTKEAKTALIEDLAEKFQDAKFFYVTDFSSLTVAETTDFRRKCFENNVEMRVVKNTLIRKALERVSDTAYEGLYEDLKGPSAILFAENGKVPATILKEYRGRDGEKPALKVAYIDQDIIRGDEQLDFLTKLKSKEDLLGELVTLLQSPAKNLVSQLKGPEQKLIGLVRYGGDTMMALLKGIEQK
jgi:large subunit ribosomal protein L10